MTAVTATAYRSWTHRAAHRLGLALTEWANRPEARAPLDGAHIARIARAEADRERALRGLPQVPR